MDVRRIIFDLDGTLVDASDRMYLLFVELVPGCTLSKGEYWELKRNGVSHREILSSRYGYSEEDFHLFERRWMNEIESPRSIRRDALFPSVRETLAHLRGKGIGLYLVTARQDSAMAEAEVASYGIDAFFDSIMVAGPDRDKRRALLGLAPFDGNDVFVGDTGRDVEVGRSLGGSTVAVAGGFMSRDCLLGYSPDIVVDGIGGLLGCFSRCLKGGDK